MTTPPSAPDVERVARELAREFADHFWNDTGVLTASAQRFMRERISAALAAQPRADVQRLAETEYQESDLARLARPPAPDGDGTTVGIPDAPLVLGDIDLAAIRARCEAAHSMVSDLCHRRREWIMSIPARPDYDPDIVIADSLRDIPTLLTALTAALAEGERLKEQVAERGQIIGQLHDAAAALTTQLSEARAALKECAASFTLFSTERQARLGWTKGEYEDLAREFSRRQTLANRAAQASAEKEG